MDKYDLNKINKMFSRMDKLSDTNRGIMINKFLGALSVLEKDEKVWQEFEKYLLECEDVQSVLPLGVMETESKIIDSYYPNKLDRFPSKV